MTIRRYTIKCRSCDGSGFHRWTDTEGDYHLDDCRCYRGRVTIHLTPEDERVLLKELSENLK